MNGLFFYCKQESWERENSVDYHVKNSLNFCHPSEEGMCSPSTEIFVIIFRKS